METLRQIAEDAFLLAANIRNGEDLDASSYGPESAEDYAAMREYRIVELVIDLGERICRASGVTDPWVPADIGHLVDPA